MKYKSCRNTVSIRKVAKNAVIIQNSEIEKSGVKTTRLFQNFEVKNECVAKMN